MAKNIVIEVKEDEYDLQQVEEEVEKKFRKLITEKLGEHNVAEIVETIVTAQSSWDSILEFLDVPKYEIVSCHRNNERDVNRLSEGLIIWLHHDSYVVLEHNWQSILAALRDDKVGHGRLADTIEDNFRQLILRELYPAFCPVLKERSHGDFDHHKPPQVRNQQMEVGDEEEEKLHEILTKRLSENDLFGIVETIVSAVPHWKSILEYLQVPTYEIESLSGQNKSVTMKLAGGIRNWMHAARECSPPRNWQSILDALRDKKVRCQELADTIEDKFRQSIRQVFPK